MTEKISNQLAFDKDIAKNLEGRFFNFLHPNIAETIKLLPK